MSKAAIPPKDWRDHIEQIPFANNHALMMNPTIIRVNTMKKAHVKQIKKVIYSELWSEDREWIVVGRTDEYVILYDNLASSFRRIGVTMYTDHLTEAARRKKEDETGESHGYEKLFVEEANRTMEVIPQIFVG